MARVVDDFDVGDVVESLLLGGFGHPKFDRGSVMITYASISSILASWAAITR